MAELFRWLSEAGKSSYRTLGKGIVATRLWNCERALRRLEAKRRQLDLQSRSVILTRVHLEHMVERSLGGARALPPRGTSPVLVRSMGRSVNG